jgi:cytochrome oxidase Cu insertion factor (SCO1/SenC/PrrC family)
MEIRIESGVPADPSSPARRAPWLLKSRSLLVTLLLVNAVAWRVALVPTPQEDSVHAADTGVTTAELGTSLPQVTVFDDQGHEFEFASLQGSYAVITFGCLT